MQSWDIKDPSSSVYFHVQIKSSEREAKTFRAPPHACLDCCRSAGNPWLETVGDNFRGDEIWASLRKWAHRVEGALNTTAQLKVPQAAAAANSTPPGQQRGLLCIEAFGHMAAERGWGCTGGGEGPFCSACLLQGWPAQPLSGGQTGLLSVRL